MADEWITIGEELGCSLQAKGIFRRLINEQGEVVFEWQEEPL